ncbi:response regulator [Methanospirillum lacunae]|uniref:Two-component system response regulator n=1 Tax=Methanospirillum lacunae TaxID=668570 RepID=A0A2V2N2L7_9EURY|nr:response regulator [Methanospirillum lacunae]PWR74402.1 two-component system response regulator [Methanospirillum lacunae]
MSVEILVVDDEPALNELFVIGLKKYGFSTEGVLGGRECLDLLKDEYRPDLILLDMMMEPMDGWETLHHIKADPDFRKIPVIMQTGKNLTFKEAEQFSYYIEDYIMKPITPKRCVDIINEILEKQRIIQALIDKAHAKGCSESEIDHFVTIHRANDVSGRLMHLLEDRYGSSTGEQDPDSYGPEDFQIFRSKIKAEYDLLIQNMGINT